MLCRQQIDVLSHAALRARATGAFVACCSDAEPLDAIARDFNGQQVQLRMDGDTVSCSAHDGAAPAADAQHVQHAVLPTSEVVKPPALDSDRCAVAALTAPWISLCLRPSDGVIYAALYAPHGASMARLWHAWHIQHIGAC